MGRKRSHKSDKLYITVSEYTAHYGGKSNQVEINRRNQPLPFYCCALGLTPFKDPFCTQDGVIYDLMNIVPFIRKYKVDPATGKPLAFKDLIKLKFSKNEAGSYQCPILYREFTKHSHIVAVRPSGNVYSYEAIEQLNFHTDSWTDLITGEPFTKDDIITLQNPLDSSSKRIGNFFYIQKGLKVKGRGDAKKPTIRPTAATSKILTQLEKTEQAQKAEEKKKKKEEQRQKYKSASFTCAGFTGKETTEDFPRKIVTKKGYVRLQTNFGDLNFELHSDKVPLACENFLELCERGYYDNTVFHRSIRHFMIQGGDPEGTGRGGESMWKKPFPDEFHRNLLHEGRGVLCMANHGPNTNGSQFYITYRSAKHLNFKHTVFGRLVGGMETLRKMEAVPTTDNDVPVEQIRIISTPVFSNPFRELEEDQKAAESAQEKLKQNQEMGQWFSNPSGRSTEASVGSIGKYIGTASSAESQSKAGKRKLQLSAVKNERPQKKKAVTMNQRFDNW